MKFVIFYRFKENALIFVNPERLTCHNPYVTKRDATDNSFATKVYEPSLEPIYPSTPVFRAHPSGNGRKVTLNSRISIYLSPVERRRVLPR